MSHETRPVIISIMGGQILALQEAIAEIWHAHHVMISNGVTTGTFKRHVEPAIYEAAKLLPEEMRLMGAPKIERKPKKSEFEDLL